MGKKKSKRKYLDSYCTENGLKYLLEEWDYENNNGKTPADYTFGSKETVHWKCKQCGTSFPARINTRVYYRTQCCKECAKKQSWKTRHEKTTLVHNLTIDFPNIAKEWDYERNNGIIPEDVTKGTHDTYYWKCPKGHPSYPARVSNRVYNGEGCPVCSGRKLKAGENDLETINPLLAAQWDYERNYPKTPKEVFPREGKKYWWICPVCGESYPALVCNRAAGKSHDKCSKKGTSFPEQAIYYYVKECFPDTISRDTSFGFELDIYVPSIKVAIEYDGVKYHKGEKSFIKDNNKDGLCEKNDIKLFRFRDPVLPSTQSAVRITCPDNREFLGDGISLLLSRIAPDNRKYINPQNDYYVIFNNTLLNQKEKSIIITHPEIAAEWHPTKNLPLSPEKVTSGMKIDVWWLCLKCGNEYQAKMYSRKAGRGCPECGKKTRAKKRSLTAARKNNFLMQYPKLAEEFSPDDNPGIDISKLSAGSGIPIIWTCSKCGHKWPASVSKRTQGYGCEKCGRERTKKAAERAVINLDTGEYYASITLAAEAVDGDKRSICTCCGGRTKTAYGYHWAYAEDKCRKNNTGMLIHNIETNEFFNTIQEAANKYRCDRSSISSALNGKTKTSMGYHWEFVKK